jgi:hypothetical protein
VSSRATFVVEHTRDWPSGASWALANGHAILPFSAVRSWSPDPDAEAPAAVSTEPDPSPDEEPEAPEEAAPREPAIVRELAEEIDRTGALLRMMPPTQLDWSPHPDLPTLRTLARRLIRIVARIRWIVELDVVELSFEPDLPELGSLADLTDTYDASAATAAELTPALTGAALRETWRLERNGVAVVQHTRGEALRAYGLRPLVYHQAEIALLLTAMELPVPHPYPTWQFAEEVPNPTTWATPGADGAA